MKQITAAMKALGIDMINKANSGHPGIVLGASPILTALFHDHLNINVEDPKWLGRDRFVMSAGHGSALLYAAFYLAGYPISLDDLKQFRQLGSITPGHPEYNVTPGVEVSTGPLGQGLATAVGMAMAEKRLEAAYKLKDGQKIFDYKVYVLCGDGDLMEGISYEASSLAGTLKLNNLIVLYDSNGVSLDGKTNMTFTEDIQARFKALGWNTLVCQDGMDEIAISNAITEAKKSDRPTLIEVKTTIGSGSLLEGQNIVHGKALSMEDIAQLKEKLKVSGEFNPFLKEQASLKEAILKRVTPKYLDSKKMLNTYLLENNLKDIFEVPNYKLDASNALAHEEAATRVTNEKIMNVLAKEIPNFLGGSADLASSVKTYLKDEGDYSKDNYLGRNIWYGVREHAAGAISNGLALSNLLPFMGTFLVFADYVKPAIRLSALMDLPVTYIFSHDSINVGEDGPTHEPIEQLAMLRTIPNMTVIRPCDAQELVGSWNVILKRHKPAALILSRVASIPVLTTDAASVEKGAYIVRKEAFKLHGIIIATGYEVGVACKLASKLYESVGLDLRVVSMPSRELFINMKEEYQKEILPDGVRKVFIEASNGDIFSEFVYSRKYLITLNEFGKSGQSNDVLTHFAFDEKSLKERLLKLFL